MQDEYLSGPDGIVLTDGGVLYVVEHEVSAVTKIHLSNSYLSGRAEAPATYPGYQCPTTGGHRRGPAASGQQPVLRPRRASVGYFFVQRATILADEPDAFERTKDTPRSRLREGRAALAEQLPPGYRVRASGAAQNLPLLPWLAVLDLDITSTAQEGLYVAYLFTQDLHSVYLSMNQGVTAHRDYYRAQGDKRPGAAALSELRRESQLLRDRLGTATNGLLTDITLGGTGFLGDGYEAGNVVAIGYSTSQLPTDEELHRDLDRFLGIYRDCVAIRNELVLSRPGEFHTSTQRTDASADGGAPTPQFRPKDASEYIAAVPAQTQRRTRKHEELVRRFGEQVRRLGYTAATNVHPRDLVVHAHGAEYLVEAKTVGNNAEYAVREAIGQLFTYRYFCYQVVGKPWPTLIALLSESVGPGFVELLQLLHIEVSWRDGDRWQFTPGLSPIFHDH